MSPNAAQKTTGLPSKKVLPPIFFFIGPPTHGKTTARKIFCELTKMKGHSCSEVIYAHIARHRGIPVAELMAEDKAALRPLLIEVGNYLCGDIGKLQLLDNPEKFEAVNYFRSPSALIRTLVMSGTEVIDGVRRRLELEEAKKHLAWMGRRVLVVWVETPGKPIIKDNTELTANDADIQLINDGSVADLRQKIERWVAEMSKPPAES